MERVTGRRIHYLETLRLRQEVIDAVSCPYCFAPRGVRCKSVSEKVGTCELRAPHVRRVRRKRAMIQHRVNFTPLEATAGDAQARLDLVIEAIPCPTCQAPMGSWCRGNNNRNEPHVDRVRIAKGILQRKAILNEIPSGFGNDDRLMELALDREQEFRDDLEYEPGEPYATPYPPEKGYGLARDVYMAVKCNFCGADVGNPCVVWNREKNKYREYPHAVRYSDYNRAKHQMEDSRRPQEALNAQYEWINDNYIQGPDDLVPRRGSEVAKKDVLNRHLDRILNELDKLELIGEDVYENDTVLSIKYKHPNGDKEYDYVALKSGDRWYVTGYQNQGPRSWENMMEYFSKGEIVNIWVASEWEQIV